ncbi:cell cycle protein [Mycoplasmopsis fermentans JER]|nr:cell cycle protein [Mycoplasmopsis fermentans JER]
MFFVKVNNMYILGISGGPDSMLLLHEYAYKKEPIFVVCINYNQRMDSHKDVEIVENYCKQNFIDYQIYNFDQKDYKTGNFEEWARDKRMEIFIQNYHEKNASKILLAHHKDDFLESFFMQKVAKRKPSFWGIKKTNIYKGCLIERPFIDKYFKDEILEKCKKLKLDYAIDYTNELPIYTRNKFRLKLKKLTNEEKQKIIDEVNEKNKELEWLEKEFNKAFASWKKIEFKVNYYKDLDYEIQEQLIRKFIFAHCEDKINLTSGKIKNLVNYVIADNTNNPIFILNSQYYLQKSQGKLLLKSKITI